MNTIKKLHTALSQIHGEKQALQAEIAELIANLQTQRRESLELKAKLAEVIPLAKFGAYILSYPLKSDEQEEKAHELDLVTINPHWQMGTTVKPNIEATITKILKE